MNYTINNKPVIIGIDHGYGNIKTAHTCFKTGVTVYDNEPTFKSDMLIFDDRYYIIGDEHKEFTADACLSRMAAKAYRLECNGRDIRKSP